MLAKSFSSRVNVLSVVQCTASTAVLCAAAPAVMLVQRHNSNTPGPASVVRVPRGPAKPRKTQETSIQKENRHLHDLITQKQFEEAIQLGEGMAQTVGQDVLTISLLQQAYLGTNKPHKVHELVDYARKTLSKLTANVIMNGMKAASLTGDVTKADHYFAELETNKITTGVIGFDYYLRVCENAGDVSRAWNQFTLMKRRKLEPSPYTYGYLARTCLRESDFVRMRALIPTLTTSPYRLDESTLREIWFAAMRNRDDVCLRFVIDHAMSGAPIKFTSPSMKTAAAVFAERGDLPGLEKLNWVYEKLNFKKDLHFLTAELEIHARLMNVEKTAELTNQVLSGGSLIHPRALKRVLECFCHSPKALDSAYYKFVELHKAGTPVSVGSLNLVIQACAQVCEIDRAFATFADIETVFGTKPDVHSHNAVMAACAMLRQTTSAFRVFEELNKAGLQPTPYTYTILITACIREDDLQRALDILTTISKSGLAPTGDGIRLMIQKAAKDGDEALARRLLAEHISTETPSLDYYIKRGRVNYHEFEEKRVYNKQNQPEGQTFRQRTASSAEFA